MNLSLVDRIGNPDRRGCRLLRFRRHRWTLRQRRAEPLFAFGKPIMRTDGHQACLFVLRFQCLACGCRAVINTLDRDILWQLGIEVPEPEPEAST